MKKGLILALLMVFAVALTISVSANAPIVETMPTVLIGDSDDNVGDNGVLMSLNIMDFTKVIDWNNDETFTSDMFQVYLYEATPSGIEAAVPGRGATVAPINTTDYNNLVNLATTPTSSDPINQAGADAFFWLSLIDTALDTGMDPYDVGFSIADGHLISANTGYTNTATMKVIAGVTSGTQLVFDPAISEAALTVIATVGGTDSANRSYTTAANYDFTSGTNGWASSTAAPTFPAPDATIDTGGIGFTISTANPGGISNPTFGSWKSQPDLSGSQAMAGLVYRVRATLVGTAADKDVAPGYRIVATNTGYSHTAKMVSRSRGVLPASSVNVPFTGGTFTVARLYFAVPTSLGDMGDSEGQALFNDGAGLTDFRKYRLAFDVFGDGGDLGSLYATSIVVDTFGRPANGIYDISWGGGSNDTPFSEQYGGWAAATGVSGWVPGNVNISVNALTVDCDATPQASSTGRYTPVVSNSSLDTMLRPVSNTLYRFVAKVQTGDAEKLTVPTYRFSFNTSIATYNSGGLLTGVLTGIQYSEYFAYSNVKSAFGKQRFLILTGQEVCPGAPANVIETPTSIECYLYSHNVAAQWTGTGAGNVTTFSPLISLVDTMQFGTGTVWPDATSTIIITKAGWQTLGTTY